MNEMKEEIIHATERTLHTHEYTEEEILSLVSGVKKEAEDLGYVNITFNFESTMEPYEDCLGSPTIVAVGFIAKNKHDLADEEKYTRQEALAKELGCTFYEAGQYMMLKQKGIIK
jgi:hypothetical protein